MFKTVILCQGWFLLTSPEDMWQYVVIFLVALMGGGYWHVVSKEILTSIIQGSGQSLPIKKYSVPHVNSNSVQVKKLWSKVLLKAIQLNSFHHDTLLETCTWKNQRTLFKKTTDLCEENTYCVSFLTRALADFHQCLCCRNCSPRDHCGLLHWRGWGQYP